MKSNDCFNLPLNKWHRCNILCEIYNDLCYLFSKLKRLYICKNRL